MATYKLIQDIEAEDKILGPLTLRQFIFGLVAAFFIYLSVFSVTKGAAWLLIMFAPPAIFCAFFAFPFGRDQPTEIWFLAKLRFWFLPRKRIWNQSGVKEVVTITVPKKIERVLTNGLSQSEVRSRLQALANTIDSRGWAIKNVNVYAQPMAVGGADDRLIDLSSLPQEVPEDDPVAANDIMDPDSSPLAHQVDDMVNQSAQLHHQQLVDQLNAPVPAAAPASTNWFVSQPGVPAPVAQMPAPLPVVPQALPAIPTVDEVALSKQLRQQSDSQQEAYSHLRTMQPLGARSAATPTAYVPAPAVAVPPQNDPAIMQLAGNDDLDVATLARQAHKAKNDGDLSQDEVVISLR